MEDKMVRCSFSVTKEVLAEIEKDAKEQDKSVSGFIRGLFRMWQQYKKDQQDKGA